MPDRFLLYYITDRTVLAADEPARRKCLLEKITQAARAGVDYIQLRERDLPSRELESLAREAVAILNKLRTENRELRTKLLINSRTDVALSAGADGVHLRSDDVTPLEVRSVWEKCGAGTAGRVLAKAPLISVSCHSADEVQQAGAHRATLAVFAPVFEKKDRPEQRPAGLAQLRTACKAKIPVLALGGVTLANARQCRDVGAAGIAVIRLFQENDIAAVVAQLRASL